MRIELAAPTPLDPLVRRAEWQLAALVVALVVVPGALRAFEGSAVPLATPPQRVSRRPKSMVRPGARAVRPPRSC